MPVLNYVAGTTVGLTAFANEDWVDSYPGVALPTTGRTAANGNKPIYVQSAKCFWSGNGGSRSLSLQIGLTASAVQTVASNATPQDSGYLGIGYISANGGNVSVRINRIGTGTFNFGRASSGGGTVAASGFTWSTGIVGSLNYAEVPNAPTAVSVAQAGVENAVNVSWTASSSDGGEAITSYNVKWSYNSNMSGSTTVSTGSNATTFKLTDLSYGSTVYVQVAAVNLVATAAGTSSVYSSTANGFLTPPNLPLNGWANFGTLANNTFTLSNTVIPALVPETGLLRKGTSTATGGSYTTGNFGVQKTYTDLVIGRQYIVSGKAILLSAAPPGNIYRFTVVGIGSGSSVTLTSTTAGATIPSYTFTATATTHVVEIELAETFTVTTVGIQENVAFYDYALTRVATDLTYRLQDNNLEANLVDHFDLATQSVGAYWWVDKMNETEFIQDFDYVVPSATFSDVVADGNIYYTNIDTAYDTSTVINQITFDNVGRRPSALGTSKFDTYNVSWSDNDTTSVSNWGARKYELQTNLRTTVDRYNWVPNPHAAYNTDHIYIASASGTGVVNRVNLASIANGVTSYLPTGTTQPVSGLGDYITCFSRTNNGANSHIVYAGPENPQNWLFSVTPSTQYTASVYVRAGVGNQATLNMYAAIYWYDNNGVLISNQLSTAITGSSTVWSRPTVTVTVPSNAVYASVWAYFNHLGGNSAGHRYYATGAQLTTGATAQDWFSGDSVDNATYVYEWEGQPGSSRSIRYNNIMDTRTGELLAEFANPTVRFNSLTFNTAQNPILSAQLDIGSTIRIQFKNNADPINRTNLCVNPNFETNATNWSANLGSVTRVTTTPQTGTHCLQMNSDVDNDLSAGYLRNASLTIGTAYRAGMWVRVSTGTQALTMSLLAGIGAISTTSFTATTTWQFIQTPTITATGTSAQISLDGAGVSANVFVDSAIIETTSTYTETFFDGNTPDAGGVDYAWTGTANASTSTATANPLPPIYRVAGISHDINPERWMMTLQVAKVT